MPARHALRTAFYDLVAEATRLGTPRLIHWSAWRLERRWRRQRRRDIRRHRKDVAGFERRLATRWRAGLDGLDLLWLHAHQEGAHHNELARPAAAADQDYKFDALSKLHARSCRVASEVSALLRTGHADGAHSRWRSLHELVVTMYFIAANDRDVAERYLLHEAARAHSAGVLYQEHSSELGYEPVDDQELAALEGVRGELERRFGTGYARPYGWAAATLGVPRPSFADVEKAVSMERWRPWFRMASEATHAGSRGLAFTLGLTHDDDLLLAGPSNLGLSDPGASTAISLAQATVAFLAHRPTTHTAAAATVMLRLARDVENDFNGGPSLRGVRVPFRPREEL